MVFLQRLAIGLLGWTLLLPSSLGFSPLGRSASLNLATRNRIGRLAVAEDEKAEPLDRAQALPEILRYRGAVDNGYGRGGKKLGIPTANLPSSLFQDALETVPAGVYFGWAALEDQAHTNKVYKAVVNVGFSPTFEGQENKEKIIEAHLILSEEEKEGMADFYGVTMRLQLLGFLREEQKFDSFPALVAQINADVVDAAVALETSPYSAARFDAFLTDGDTWVGSGGGDDTASWESEVASSKP